MAYGMPPGFNQLLRRKYDILQQQADAVSTNAQTNKTVGEASAALDRTRNRFLPDQARADIANTEARTRNVNVTTDFLPDVFRSEIDLRGAQAANQRASAFTTRQRGIGEKQINQLFDVSGYFGGGGGVMTSVLDDAEFLRRIGRNKSKAGRSVRGSGPGGLITLRDQGLDY